MDETLLRLLRGELRVVALPDRLDLGPLWEGLADLCQRSLGCSPAAFAAPMAVKGEMVEWGACLVCNDASLRLEHQVPGWADGVRNDDACKPVKHKPPEYAGFSHTHLPVADGRPVLGFSESDFRATLAAGDKLALVCNGPEVFALVRTIDATVPACEIDDTVYWRWGAVYRKLIAQARVTMQEQRQAASDALGSALWQANRQLCEELGFAFYSGRWGKPLARIYTPFPRS